LQELIDNLEAQFMTLDVSGDGVLGLDDFPPGRAVDVDHQLVNSRA
jgi:hypothetical protein